ncbi:hypothetical protein SK128_001719 [Halocaridina rubra]|uniref:RanBP2-type domain-containing protein n=1 Tax=Halocaridina rubra TaxID=373956 RepID=A0AAN8WZK8_HALRR
MEERQEANQTAERQPKRSLIDDLKGMSQEFDFSTMGTMGDFSAWGFGNTDDGSDDNNKLNEDNRWRGRSQERGSRGSDRDRDRDRDRGRRDGGRDYHRGRDGGGGFQRGNRDDDRGRNRRFGGREHSRNNDTPMKKGDWICRDCDFVNFASRTQCFKCNTSKDQRKSLPGGRSESGGNSSSYMGKRKSQDYSDEGHCEEDNDYGPPPEPEKRSKLDEDMFEAPMMTSWTDIKEFDDDHDAEMFTEENEYLTQRYGENVVRVRYTNKGLVGYYCMICDVEMTGEKPLDLHCRGMKHLKKKERRDNPEPFDPLPRIVNKDKKGGERDRPRLLPPEAFSRESGNDIGRSSDPHGGRSRSHSGSGGGQFGGSSGSGGNALQGSPTGALLSKLADCSVKSEGDAELATNVISLLLKSLKDYSMKKGESKVAELLLQAELKMSTIKALKVGLQYLAGGQGSGGGMDRMGGRGGMDRMGGGGGGMDRMSGEEEEDGQNGWRRRHGQNEWRRRRNG